MNGHMGQMVRLKQDAHYSTGQMGHISHTGNSVAFGSVGSISIEVQV